MDRSEEIYQAARALGAALRCTPEMQAFEEANAAARADEDVCALEAAVLDLYNTLTARQQAGQALAQYEINRYYKLRDELVRHPLIERRDLRMKAVKALFETAGGAISSVLAVDYTALVLEED
jgi:cell fate (sporulation/competence/biofilm development) regulator YlbF (YheA/YmcA/DUF963 family)